MVPPPDHTYSGALVNEEEERTEFSTALSFRSRHRKSSAVPVKNVKRRRVPIESPNEEKDQLGRRILELLLHWEKKRRRSIQFSPPPLLWQWKPFISLHNVKVIVQWVCSIHWNRVTRKAGNFFRDISSSLLDPYALSIYLCNSVLLPFVILLIGISIIMSLLLTIAAFAVVRVTAILSAFLLDLLIDYKSLLQNRFLRTLLSGLRYLYFLLDYYICQGYRFAGREWNATTYLFPTLQRGKECLDWRMTGKCPAHTYTTLTQSPPPDMTSLAMWRWSNSSKHHLQGIHYCHMLLLRSSVNQAAAIKAEIDKAYIKREEPQLHVENTAGIARSTYPTPSDTSDEGADMAWIDVGAKIGLRLLHSEHVQRAMTSQDAKDRILEKMSGNGSSSVAVSSPISKINAPPVSGRDFHESITKGTTASPRGTSTVFSSVPVVCKPMHSMWTSPGAAVELTCLVQATCSYVEPEEQDDHFADDSTLRKIQSYPPSPLLQSPPISPTSGRLLSDLIHSIDVPKMPLNPLLHSPNSLVKSDHHFINATESSSSQRISLHVPDLSHLDATAKQQWSERSKCYPLNRRLSSGVLLGSSARIYRRQPLQSGMKIAVPIVPFQPTTRSREIGASSKVSYMMATVVSSTRIFVENAPHSDISPLDPKREPNCLSVTVKVDKFFLRNGEFADLTLRILDDWSPRFMPRHSKVPMGACVATSFGIGVLVGWRVEDDCHVVRSLWHCRGSGSAYAYLNRQAIHATTVAANGFRVQTVFGHGIVRACVNGGSTFTSSRFYVEIREEGRQHKGTVLDLDSKEIISCHGAQFMPVIEHVRAAALYQIQVDNYNAALQEHRLIENATSEEQEFLRTWSSCADILWHSFLKAVEEDKDFDDGVHEFVQSIIDFLDRLDQNEGDHHDSPDDPISGGNEIQLVSSDEIEIQLDFSSHYDEEVRVVQEPGFWFMNDLFGGVFKYNGDKDDCNDTSKTDGATRLSLLKSHSQSSEDEDLATKRKKSYFDRAFAVLRSAMKTVSIARASSVDHPHFRLALAIIYDVLLFMRTILKIQQRNASVDSLKIWKRAWGEVLATFGPIKERLESIGRGIAYRMEHQGKKAKIRVLKFVDNILGDERLLVALEQGEWDKCLAQVEIALVAAEVIEEKNLIYYRKAAKFVYEQVEILLKSDEGAAARNNEKLALLAFLIQSMAAPRRSILKIFCRDDTLELLERILVRTYCKEEIATRMLLIHAANFHSLRHLRILKDFSVSGRIWIPLLDAANEELTCFVATLPENSKGIVRPLSILFSLCVAQFHKINDGDLSKDWLAFLLEEESVRIIQEIDMLLILALESFSHDIREMMTVLPYYASIDEDILNLMDEVNIDEFLREAASVIDDPDKLTQYLRDKATIAIERFLNYLPKMSIPIEKRDLGDGWMLSCHGRDGGGLTMTDVTIRRENVVCQIMGGDTLFFPMFAESECTGTDSISTTYSILPESVSVSTTTSRVENEEESILNHIKDLILNAEKYGCWYPGLGGVGQSLSDPYAASVFQDVPVSSVLNCSIDLWRNLQIDDEELLEIAIRDISYHIQLQEREETKARRMANQVDGLSNVATAPCVSESTSSSSSQLRNSHSVPRQRLAAASVEGLTTSSRSQRRFNPRIDPTVLFLEIKRLTLNLDNFFFRIEKSPDRKTIFDPVFAGRGMLSLRNISIRLRVECAKERVRKPEFTMDIVTPILQLRSLDVTLEKLTTTVKDTGFGSDWILNKAVEVFEEKLTEVVEVNLKDQIQEQVQNAIDSLNSYFLMNPNVLLSLLDISMDDLEETVVWV